MSTKIHIINKLSKYIRHFCGVLFGTFAVFCSALLRCFIRHFCDVSSGTFAVFRSALLRYNILENGSGRRALTIPEKG